MFRDDRDRHLFLRLLSQQAEELGWKVLSYCLMGNHYHLLVKDPEGTLSVGMQRLNGRYAQRFNQRHGRVGHLWQGRFHSVLIETEGHLVALARYVALNPVRAGLCDRPHDWRWSSHRSLLGLAPAAVPDGGLLAFFGRTLDQARRWYAALVGSGRDPAVEDDGADGAAVHPPPAPPARRAPKPPRRRGRRRRRPRGRGG